MGLRRRKRRGGILLEFVLSVPFALLLVLLTIDVGRLILVNTALQDAVAVSARSGARQGIVGANPAGAGQPCQTLSSGFNPSYDAFCEAARNIPGATLVSFQINRPSGSQSSQRICTRPNQIYVEVEARARVDLLTPGLRSLTNGAVLPDGVRAVGVARCEVAR
jgi:Flp pilus assembly protein TadG